MNPLPKVVAFDLGGVLVRINMSIQSVLGMFGLEAAAPWDSFWTCEPFLSYQRGAISDQEYLNAFSTTLGLSAVESRTVHNCILLEAYSGTLDLILELRSRGVRTGCLSNTNGLHWDAMKDASVFANVCALEPEIKVASHLVHMEKPNEDIYREFEHLSGCTGREIVYFEDGPANVETALRLGWRTLLIDPLGDPNSQMRSFLGL